MQESLLGKKLDGRYKVTRSLAVGGFGQTYIAEDIRRPGHPQCVVKLLKPACNDPDFLENAKRLFITEAETLERLGSHDQVPRLLAYFVEGEDFYLVQEYIDGSLLTQELCLGKCWPLPKAVELIRDVLQILRFIHSQNVIHRDIKPDNIIRRRGDDQLVLVDFGTVKQIRTRMAVPGQATATISVGTPGYMPTEQSHGKPRTSSDIYALGVIAIQAITGLNPNQLQEDDESGELIWQPWAECDLGLIRIVEKMVRYHFRDRYRSASEALQALDLYIKSYPELAQELFPSFSAARQPATSIVLKPTAIADSPQKIAPKVTVALDDSEALKPKVPRQPPAKTEVVNASATDTDMAGEKVSAINTISAEKTAPPFADPRVLSEVSDADPLVTSFGLDRELQDQQQLDAVEDSVVDVRAIAKIDRGSEKSTAAANNQSAAKIPAAASSSKVSMTGHTNSVGSIRASSPAAKSNVQVLEAPGSVSAIPGQVFDGSASRSVSSVGSDVLRSRFGQLGQSLNQPRVKIAFSGVAALAFLTLGGLFFQNRSAFAKAEKSLAQAQQFKEDKAYDECVAAAQTVGARYAQLHSSAQDVMGSCWLGQAETLATAHRLKDAIALSQNITPDMAAYPKAKSSIPEWSQKIFETALNNYKTGQYESAKSIMQSIPPNSDLQTSVTQMLDTWQTEWQKNTETIAAAKKAVDDQSWQLALDEAEKVTLMGDSIDQGNPYWKETLQPIVTKAKAELAAQEAARVAAAKAEERRRAEQAAAVPPPPAVSPSYSESYRTSAPVYTPPAPAPSYSPPAPRRRAAPPAPSGGGGGGWGSEQR